MQPIVLTYNEPLIRSVVWSFWRRTVGWGFLTALVFVGVAIATLCISGDRGWLLGVFVSTFILGLSFVLALFVVHYRSSLARFRRMKEPKATLELFDDKFRVTSDVGSSEIVWGAVTDLWKFKDYWLLFLSKAQFITLPLDALTSENRHFIESQVTKNRGRGT